MDTERVQRQRHNQHDEHDAQAVRGRDAVDATAVALRLRGHLTGAADRRRKKCSGRVDAGHARQQPGTQQAKRDGKGDGREQPRRKVDHLAHDVGRKVQAERDADRPLTCLTRSRRRLELLI